MGAITGRAVEKRSRKGWAILISGVAPVLFGFFNLMLGKDANWDFLNYRYYNAWAFLHDRLTQDVAVAHHATYYNPLIDIPFFLATQHLPAWGAGFLLATVQGLGFTLLFWLGWGLYRVEPNGLRLTVASLIALFGMTGGGALGQLGVVSYDNVLALWVMGALLVVVYRVERICEGPWVSALGWSFLAGFLAGSAAGLKLTAALYCVGLCLAFGILSATFTRRVLGAFVFGLGVLAAMAVFSLPWSLKLLHLTGNPFFPYFNSIFHSPLVSDAFNRDATFIPESLFIRVFFPFYFTFNPFRVAEFVFRDVRLLLVFILFPIALAFTFMKGKKAAVTETNWMAANFVLAAASFSYLVWLGLFCIYRYLIPLEMLAPLLIALSMDRLPFSRNLRLGLLLILLFVSQLAAYSEFDKRLSWASPYVAVDRPFIERPRESLVLLTGTSPLGYALPGNDPGISFLRIQSYMTGGDPPNGLDLAMMRRVAEHSGDLFTLFAPWELASTHDALGKYSLAIKPGTCRELFSNVASPLTFCSVTRGITSPGS